jgi:hypothetical protein
MPILYVHGVATRSRDGFLELRPYLERLVAPAISDDPGGVLIDDVYWGGEGVTFAWDGASRPRTRVLGMGPADTPLSPVEGALTAAAFAEAFKRLPAGAGTAAPASGLISGGPPAASRPPAPRLRDLRPDELGDLLAVVIGQQVADPARRARLVLAADAVAHDPGTGAALAATPTSEAEVGVLFDRVARTAGADPGLVAMGLADWVTGARDRLGEALGRAADLPAWAVSVAAAELRPALNDLVSVFLGDVFAYLRARGDASAPGPIPRLLLEGFRRARDAQRQRGGELLVVLTHSMGGQLVYDAVTHFLPGTPDLRELKVDFWCATASQVGFFEEAKLFLAKDPQYRTGHPVPFPRANLGVWWNVWDHNDFLSYTARGIIDGLVDEAYDSGMSLLAAHGGYLKRPSFFRKLAERLAEARARHGGQP